MSTLPMTLSDPSARPINAPAASSDRAIGWWLVACCVLLFAMVVVGGATRLTNSGLSIVEWKPLVGAIPPLSEAAWIETFAKYQQTPEFKLKNFDMTLDGFKGIFWWEYFHRLLGRLIGVVFLVPFLWFLARGRLSPELRWKLGGIFLLGALQGGMGWYMVQSGLVNEPRVSHLRLTAHLGLAFVIFAAQWWLALSLLTKPEPRTVPKGLRRFSRWVVAIVFLMVLSGGMVAGLRAGYAYNTFPLMHGHVIPPDLLILDPWTSNFIWNMTTIQFNHRMIAWLLVLLIPLLCWRTWRAGLSRTTSLCVIGLLAALAMQFALGVATLIHVVPVPLGVAHQGGAMALFCMALTLAHRLR